MTGTRVVAVMWTVAGFLAVLSVAILCYWNTLSGELVHDDRFAIKENMDLRPTVPFAQVFANDFWGKPMADPTSHKSYRPLTVLTFRVNYALHQLSPWGYHAVNVALHAVASCLVVLVSWVVVFGALQPAVTTGLLFAAHPVHTEAVAGVVGRADVLSCIFFLLAFLSYWRCRLVRGKSLASALWLVGCVLCGTAATLSKEPGITVFGVCMVCDAVWVAQCCRRKGHTTVGLFWKHSKFFVLRISILLATIASLLIIRLHVQGGQLPHFTAQDNPASFSNSTLTRTLTFHYLTAFNGALLLAPITLSYDWQMGSIPLVETVRDTRNAETVFLYLLLTGLLFRSVTQLKKLPCQRPVVMIGLCLVVIPFIPASNLFFRVGFVVAERILYLPSIGYCVLLSYGVLCVERLGAAKFSEHMDNTGGCQRVTTHTDRRRLRSICVAACLVLLCGVFAAKTVVRNRVWLSREALFKSGVSTLPHNAKAHYNYANFLKDVGRVGEAVQHYKEAVWLAPDHASSHNNLGTLLEGDEAERHLRQAVLHNPRHSRAYYNLGNLLGKQDKSKEAIHAFEQSLKIDDSFADAWSSYGGALAKMGRCEEAVSALQKVLLLSSTSADVYSNTATYFQLCESHGDSMKAAEAALSLQPEHPSALSALALVYRKLGRTEEAERLYQRSLSVKEDPNVLYLLCALYYNTGRANRAAAVAERLLAIDPLHHDGHCTYALALIQLNRYSEAEQTLKQATVQFPHSPEPLKHLSSIMLQRGRLDEALKYAETAVPLCESDDIHLLTTLASIHRERESYVEAEKVFSHIVKLDPSRGSAWLNLGAVHHIMGNLEKARTLYQRAAAVAVDEDTRSIADENTRKVDRLLSRKRVAKEDIQ